MTGFGRAQGVAAWGAWAWEARSVNGKSLDVRYAGPPGFDAVEFEARKRAKERFQRGSLQIQLRIDLAKDQAASSIDTRELARALRLSRGLARSGFAPASAGQLLALPSVSRAPTRTGQAVDEGMVKDLLAGFDQAMAALEAARAKEGETLGKLFGAMLGEIEQLVGKAAALAAGQPELVRERFRARLAELAVGEAALDPDRVLQEASILAVKADVREEIDRLTAHIASARAILGAKEAAGRKLDFLCQEFNREANTLASKSASLELTNVGLALKSTIDQFREQAQNVE